MKIGNYLIEKNSAPFIIAEAGINHNGELNKMLEMIDVAKECGADAIKFQTFKAHELCADKTLTYTYKSQGREITESMYEMFKRVEVREEYWKIIKEKCDSRGIVFMSTPQNVSDLNILLKVGIPAIKVGSDDFITTPLLEEYKKTGLAMILSCGMADENEIRMVMGHFKNYPVALLLCTSQYPTNYEDVNLNKLKTIQKEFPNLITGFSDHTRGSLAACMAHAMGAVIFEKHFTLSHNLPGPDHWFSADPDELKEWCLAIKNSHKILGSDIIKPTKEEEHMREIARRKLIAGKDINKNEIFTSDNIELKRAQNGLSVLFYDKITNKASKRNIKKGEFISESDFDE